MNAHEATLKVDMAGLQSEGVEGEGIQEFAMHRAMSADLLQLGYVLLLVYLAVALVHPQQLVIGQIKQAHNNALNWVALTFKRRTMLWRRSQLTQLKEVSGNATSTGDEEVEP